LIVEITSIDGSEGLTSAGVISGFSVIRAAMGTATNSPGRAHVAARGAAVSASSRIISTKRLPILGQVNSLA
jgi:hypothetical protein